MSFAGDILFRSISNRFDLFKAWDCLGSKI